MRFKIEFSYKGQRQTFDSQTGYQHQSWSRWTSNDPGLQEVLREATQVAFRNSQQGNGRFFQHSPLAPAVHAFALPEAFIIKSPEKLLSAPSNSFQAQMNKEVIEKTPEGFCSKTTYTTRTSNEEIVQVEVPVQVLKVIDDMSQGDNRVLMPLVKPKESEKKQGVRRPGPTNLHVPTTANCSLDEVFGVYLGAIRRGTPNAMAVGFVENPEGNYLIIAGNKMDYLQIKNRHFIEIGLITWYIAKDIPLLLKTLFSHIPLQAGTAPAIPQFFNYTEGRFEEIKSSSPQEEIAPTHSS